jgi:hypothetical protein
MPARTPDSQNIQNFVEQERKPRKQAQQTNGVSRQKRPKCGLRFPSRDGFHFLERWAGIKTFVHASLTGPFVPAWQAAGVFHGGLADGMVLYAPATPAGVRNDGHFRTWGCVWRLASIGRAG